MPPLVSLIDAAYLANERATANIQKTANSLLRATQTECGRLNKSASHGLPPHHAGADRYDHGHTGWPDAAAVLRPTAPS